MPDQPLSRTQNLAGEPRAVRELREAIREAEATLERIHMSPAVALAWGPNWYLRQARLALRQAERHAAKADDPRLPELKPLRAQLRERRPTGRPRRTRVRCPTCFYERLAVVHGTEDYPAERLNCPRRDCYGVMEPVARMPKGATDA